MMLSSGDIQELMIDNARGHSDPYIYIWKTEITFIAGNMMLQVAFTVVSKKKKKEAAFSVWEGDVEVRFN